MLDLKSLTAKSGKDKSNLQLRATVPDWMESTTLKPHGGHERLRSTVRIRGRAKIGISAKKKQGRENIQKVPVTVPWGVVLDLKPLTAKSGKESNFI